MHFNWLQLLPGINHHNTDVALAIFCTALIVLFSIIARLSLGFGEKAIQPSSKPSVKGFFEVFIEFIHDLGKMVLGEDAKHYTSTFASVFFFILFCNWIGLVPGLGAITGQLNMAFAIGLASFFLYNFMGLKHGGFGYLAHFLGPNPGKDAPSFVKVIVIALIPLILPIELISHSIRPLSLGMRLSVNMTVDHIIFSTFSELSPYIVPIIFYGMGAFVGFIQAFVFTLLSMVYVMMATAHDH